MGSGAEGAAERAAAELSAAPRVLTSKRGFALCVVPRRDTRLGETLAELRAVGAHSGRRPSPGEAQGLGSLLGRVPDAGLRSAFEELLKCWAPKKVARPTAPRAAPRCRAKRQLPEEVEVGSLGRVGPRFRCGRPSIN